MAKQTEHGIVWTDRTWNPIRGCTRVSEGCRNCYAEGTAGRFSGVGQPYHGLAKLTAAGARWTGKVAFVEEHLEDPLHWKKPQRVFVNSMSDLFHPDVRDEWIRNIFSIMESAQRHNFQILTKRPERMLTFISDFDHWLKYAALKGGFSERFPNVWLGVSVEDQKTADERLPLLVKIPAAVRWVSYEPALGPIDFANWMRRRYESGEMRPYIDWMVMGGESGPGARPMHPRWANMTQLQCEAARVPFLFKQWGAWQPIEYLGSEINPEMEGAMRDCHLLKLSCTPRDQMTDATKQICFNAGAHGTSVNMIRVGKKKAGRRLEGREWNEYPK